ncbi:hypothetical protein [Nostoc sp. 'Peltigera membranacea cyanobiont' 232]|uniref:hypothetical protein n=1 Tax=Nostoc sp. 'Peltigera membranacea cyanobiont' 232 TaxID=2014531 RepID=UPI00117D2305|nr:hypothetical protein [Nostoc sp. 'Peltigera membranacea cyanobiont' 232]
MKTISKIPLSVYIFLSMTQSTYFAEAAKSEEYNGVTIEKFEKYQKISTGSFSLNVPKDWRIEPEDAGTILAKKQGRNSPFMILYSHELIKNATDEQIQDFRENQKSNRLKDNLPFDLQKFLKESIWHSGIKTVKLEPNLTKQMLDVEELIPNEEDTKQVPICTFFRQYNAYKTNLNLTIIFEGTCKDTRPELEKIENSFIWKY